MMRRLFGPDIFHCLNLGNICPHPNCSLDPIGNPLNPTYPRPKAPDYQRGTRKWLAPSWAKPHHKSPLDEINEIRRNAADSLWVLGVTRRHIFPLTAII